MLHPTNHKRSRLQESRAAKDYGGKVTPGSGNQWFQKGDVKTQDYLIECKTTTKQSYSLKLADLAKLVHQAVVENKMPVFEVEFSDSINTSRGHEFVILRKEDFLELKQRLEGE